MRLDKVLVVLGTMLLLALPVYSLGAGIINNMDFGVVDRGQTYTRTLQFWAMNPLYAPYTSTAVPDGQEGNILFIVTVSDNNIKCEGNNTYIKYNQYTNYECKLEIPMNIEKGDYTGNVCGKVCNQATGMGTCVGACATLKYSVITDMPTKKELKKSQKETDRYEKYANSIKKICSKRPEFKVCNR